MSEWKFTDSSKRVVSKIFNDGRGISCLASCLSSEELALVLPADPLPQPSPQEQINSLEEQTMLPRVTREFMLTFMEMNATSVQLAENIGYTKVKALDDQIKSLRNQIQK